MKSKIMFCAFSAIAFSLTCAYGVAQINLAIHKHECAQHHWAIQQACNTWITPGALWRGAKAGASTGAITGAVISLAVIKF
jgi:hypothetical protein